MSQLSRMFEMYLTGRFSSLLEGGERDSGREREKERESVRDRDRERERERKREKV